MRMYTSYRGMRSTGGTAAPSARRLSACVFAATPSLATLIQLLVGVVVRVPPAGALVCEPGVEPRRHQTVGAILPLRGAVREGVGVFVLRVPRVALDPAPFARVHQDAGRGCTGHVRAGSPRGYRCGAGSPPRGTPRSRWAGRRRGSCGRRRTTSRTGSA